MRMISVLSVAAAALLLDALPVMAGKVAVPPDGLGKSPLIVTGTVRSIRIEDRENPDGSKQKNVFLSVAVESVEKGKDRVKPGDVVEARCWRIVRASRDGVIWDTGHQIIPGLGGRAKFYMESQEGAVWLPHWPNGIETLDRTRPLSFALEPTVLAAPARMHAPESLWPYLAGGGGVALAILVGLFWGLSGTPGKATGGGGPDH